MCYYNSRSDIEGETANQDLHLPIILPKIPGRFYFYFGKPIETEGISTFNNRFDLVLRNRRSGLSFSA